MIHQDLTHVLRGDGDEMRPALPILARALADQAQKRFVDERGGLKGVSRALTAQVGRSQPAQFPIYGLGDLD